MRSGAAVLAFIRTALAGYVADDNELPCVLLTYAQSADGCLAAVAGRPTAISCPESLHLTHALRSEVDAILVGAPTVLSDNPSLTCRLGWPPGAGAGRSPRAIVLDPDARLPLCCKLLTDGRAARPIVITRRAQDAGPEHAERANALARAGAALLCVPALEGHARAHLDLRVALESLRGPPMGIGSIMVEGGAGVIASFLEQRLGHVAAITIAPVLLPGGLHVGGGAGARPWL
jgi:riboflavin-specific deaminase-like protein